MSLVAIKNGIHNGNGFYLDTGNNNTLIPVKMMSMNYLHLKIT